MQRQLASDSSSDSESDSQGSREVSLDSVLITGASSSTTTTTPATIPFSVYEALVRECDGLYGQNSQLRGMIDSLYEQGRTQPHDPSVAARLSALIRTATDQLRSMPMPKNMRVGEGQLLIQMMIDELQRIVDSM